MLFKKMIRDFKSNKTQFLSIFIMLFLGIGIFAGMNAVGEGMSASVTTFYEETNLADVFLISTGFTQKDIDYFSDSALIQNAERRFQINATLIGNDDKTIQLNVVEKNKISTSHLVSGEAFDIDKEGIWLDSSFAEENNLKVGDTFSCTVSGYTVSTAIKGLIMHPEYIYSIKDDSTITPDHAAYGYAFVSYKELDFLPEVPYTQILLKTDATKEDIDALIQNHFEDKTVVRIMAEDQTSVSMFNAEIEQMKAVEAVFPLIFLLIAILTMFTTMIRMTTNQRGQIGTLKALGFSNKKIIAHYLTYGILIGVVAVIIGAIIGPVLLSNLMFSMQMELYTMPYWNIAMTSRVLLAIIFCLLLCVLSCYYSCKKELKGAAADILRPKAPKVSRHTFLGKTRWWLNRSFRVQWNMRDLARNKVRMFITILGIAGCMMLTLCGFGIKNTMSNMTSWMYENLMTYTTKVTLPENISLERLAELENDSEIQFLEEMAVEVKTAEDLKSASLSVIGNRNDYIKFNNTKQEYVTLPSSGIAITNKTASILNVTLGDTIKIKAYGSELWWDIEIAAIVKMPISQGLYISQEAYEELGFALDATSFVTSQEKEAYINEEGFQIQDKQDLREGIDSTMESMNVIIVILIAAAIILEIVVLYNLGILSYSEKSRELATLKVLGFHKKKLSRLQGLQNIWLTIAGILLGTPLGILLLILMLHFMGDSMDLAPYVSMLSYVISILGTFVVSAFISTLLNSKLKKIDMVSALKSVE